MTAWLWPSSDATDKVIPAFVAALQKVEDVARNKRAAIDTKTGGKIQYGYADLDAVLDAIKPELTTHGLAFTQAPASDGVHAVLMHSSGQWLSFPPLHVTPTQNTPQALGSALSYGRRYQALAMLNIASEDDDGRAASKPRKPAAKPEDAAASPSDTPPRAARQSAAPAAPADRQHKMMMALLNGAGLQDKDAQVAYIADVTGRTVESRNDLTPAERSQVIDALKAAS